VFSEAETTKTLGLRSVASRRVMTNGRGGYDELNVNTILLARRRRRRRRRVVFCCCSVSPRASGRATAARGAFPRDRAKIAGIRPRSNPSRPAAAADRPFIRRIMTITIKCRRPTSTPRLFVAMRDVRATEMDRSRRSHCRLSRGTRASTNSDDARRGRCLCGRQSGPRHQQ